MQISDNLCKQSLILKRSHLSIFQIESSLILFDSLELQSLKMEKQPSSQNKRQTYAKIPLQTRIRLVEEVFKKVDTISAISKRLDIKLSTAKLIVKKYRQEGCFFEKRSCRLERLAEKQEASQRKALEYQRMPHSSKEVISIEHQKQQASYCYVVNPQQISFYPERTFIGNNPYLQLAYGNLPLYYPSPSYFYPYA